MDVPADSENLHFRLYSLSDNAYDPDVNASELRIDKCVIHGKPCLVFGDDGAGMDFEHLLKMLRY